MDNKLYIPLVLCKSCSTFFICLFIFIIIFSNTKKEKRERKGEREGQQGGATKGSFPLCNQRSSKGLDL